MRNARMMHMQPQLVVSLVDQLDRVDFVDIFGGQLAFTTQ